MKRILLFVLLLGFAGCDDWVHDVPDTPGLVPDDALNAEDQIRGLLNGTHNQFALAFGDLTFCADLLSDAIEFDGTASAAQANLQAIDRRAIATNNAYATEGYAALAQLRYYAENLADRVSRIVAFKDQTLRNRALFYAYLYQGMTRYGYAMYYGLSEQTGGGTINNGPFTSSSALFAQTLTLFAEAEKTATNVEKRTLNTIRARIFLMTDQPLNALTAAQNGLTSYDASLRAFFADNAPNPWHVHQDQIRPAARFSTAVQTDAGEMERIPIQKTTIGNVATYRTSKYTDGVSPITMASWLENELILAELELKNSPLSAKSRVNMVRSFFDLAPLATITAETIVNERDKTLFGTGLRIMDQRRFHAWHSTEGQWEYLPISAAERAKNPNLQ